MSMVEEFKKAIIEFGIEEACEYFGYAKNDEFTISLMEYCSTALLQNGNIIICWIEDVTGDAYFAIYTEDGVQVVAPTIFQAGDSEELKKIIIGEQDDESY